jgi:8-oxo-dGTP diphosphatase
VVSGIANSASVAVVDVANVMGARADGWWRDRAAAALRLCREVMALAQRPDSPAAAWVLVLEGQARDAVAMLSDNALPDAGAPPGDDWVPPPDEALPVRVVAAPGSGDDAIVGVVAEAVASQEEEESVLVVTADRELRARCEDLNASVVGPGWLLRLIEPGSL